MSDMAEERVANDLQLELSMLIVEVKKAEQDLSTAKWNLSHHKAKMERVLNTNKIGRQTTLDDFSTETIDCSVDQKKKRKINESD